MENTLYFVKLTPYNDLGEANNCEPISFTTGLAPEPPDCTSLISPDNGAKKVEVDTDLIWNNISGATGYFLSVGFTPGGEEIVANENIIGLTTYSFTEVFPENTKIYVRITPYGNNGLAEDCVEESFTTTGPEAVTGKHSDYPEFLLQIMMVLMTAGLSILQPKLPLQRCGYLIVSVNYCNK